MKKLLPCIALTLSSIALVPLAQADMAGIEVGTYQWSPDYIGTLSADGELTGTTVNLEDDLGFGDENHNVVWASLEHPLPFIPNFKMVVSDFDATASSVDGVEFTFNDVSFTETVTTRMDFRNTEYTMYYELLDNWINLDAGLTLRKYDGSLEIAGTTTGDTATEILDFTIPLLYAAARVDLPFTGFFIDAQINTISSDDDKMTDSSLALGYESDIGLGAKAGYRSFDMEVVEDGFNSDIEFSGAYISVFYHF